MESLDNLLNNYIKRLISKKQKNCSSFSYIFYKVDNNDILLIMHRRNLRDIYAEKVEKIFIFFLMLSISRSDVIVGFPVESYEHFINL